MRIRAKLFLKFVVVSFYVCPALLAAEPLQEIRIGSSVIGFSSFLTYFARDLKFFEKEGLDARVIYMQTNVGLAALAAGNVDYSNLATSAIEGALKGLPLKLIAVTNAEPLWGLVVQKGINRVPDLKGKKVGASSYGGSAYAAAAYILGRYGLRPKEDVTILATGGTTERLVALRHGAVDAAIIPSPGDIKAAAEGFKILFDVGTLYKLPNGGMSTTVTKIREKPAEVKNVVRALVRATRFFVDPHHREEATRYVENLFKLDRSSAEEFYRRLVPSLSPTGTVEMDRIKLVIDSALERGLISKAPNPETVVDFSFAKDLKF